LKARTLLLPISLAALVCCQHNPISLPSTSSVSIHFQHGFLNDSVSVYLDGSSVYSAVLTTNENSGLAASVTMNLITGRHALSIRVLGSSARIDSSLNLGGGALYVSVAYSKVNGKLYLKTSTVPPAPQHRAFKKKLFYSSFRSGTAQNIFMMDLDGSNTLQLTHYTKGEYRGPRISPDGKRLLYYRLMAKRAPEP
jgi:hypothetical protein